MTIFAEYTNSLAKWSVRDLINETNFGITSVEEEKSNMNDSIMDEVTRDKIQKIVDKLNNMARELAECFNDDNRKAVETTPRPENINSDESRTMNYMGICKLVDLPKNPKKYDIWTVIDIRQNEHIYKVKDWYENMLSDGDNVYWDGNGWVIVPKLDSKLNYIGEVNNDNKYKKQYKLTFFKNEMLTIECSYNYTLSNDELLNILKIISPKEYPSCKLESEDGSFMYDKRLDSSLKD